MKKIILYLVCILNLFALEGSGGIGIVQSRNKYTGEKESSLIPALNLKYENFYIRGLEFGYSEKNGDFEIGSSMRFSIGGNLEPKDLYFKIEEERKAPLFISLFAKNKISKNGNLELRYQKEIESNGDILSLGYSQRIPLNLPLLFIPFIKYSLSDGDYSDYYLGLRENEVSFWGEEYNTYQYSSKVDVGFTSLLFLTKKISFSMVYNMEFLDNNHSKIISSEKNSSFIGSLIHKF